MSGLLQDLRYALRQLRENLGFTFLAALCLALGIGVNTSVFTVLDLTILRPLPVIEPERMTIVSRAGNPLISYPEYLEYRDLGHAFRACCWVRRFSRATSRPVARPESTPWLRFDMSKEHS